ncbi:MAG: sulfatase-like hydrolase/transferase [Planctomycetaceae bacterium]|nr:sulfatase-like hydrolase/transferase [Planctomycetaceae bacterium]
MKPCKVICLLITVLTCFLATGKANEASDRPNILWLSCEDISAHLHCYGYPNARTPNLDRLATQGTRYTNAFVTAGVCAPCRSAIITGMYQTSLGTHHMRCKAELPPHVKPFPTYVREAGYYCTNSSKQDYQFKTPKGVWDESSGKAHWKKRPDKNQPFFAVFNYTGCHESGIASKGKYDSVTEGLEKIDRSVAVESLPPYYPDTPIVREDWGRYYDVITAMDRWVGEHLQALEDAGEADNTIVVYWSDHGVGLPRAKRWLYDSGMHVPLIVRIPEKYRVDGQGTPGTVSDQLVSLIDLGPTTLNLAGSKMPERVHGQAFLGANTPAPRDYVYGARDRMDERYDIIRATRDKRYKYIRNYESFKTFYQYMNTPERGALMQEIRRVQSEGTANEGVAKFLTPSKPIEELYDTQIDPHEMNNLASDPQYKNILGRMRKTHLAWVLETRDLGLVPEAEINARQGKLGSAWAILGGDQAGTLINRLRDAASLSLEGANSLPKMRQTLKDDDAAVRYWAAVGIGNLGTAGSAAKNDLTLALADDSENVRVAAARALCRMNEPNEALPVLVAVLDSGTQWARVHAANVLDEIDEQARPVLDGIKQNNVYRKGFVADGKYTVRVLNRALNELLGTNNVVP